MPGGWGARRERETFSPEAGGGYRASGGREPSQAGAIAGIRAALRSGGWHARTSAVLRRGSGPSPARGVIAPERLRVKAMFAQVVALVPCRR